MKISDNFDLIPIGAFYGKGNRTGQFGSFLMASYNSTTKMFESICKLSIGLKKEEFNLINIDLLSEDL